MPSTIPYDPSLVLGNLVSQPVLDNLVAMSAVQAPIDAAEDTLNSYIAMKRSIDMTIQELIDMNIDVTDLTKQSADTGKSIQDAAVAYAKTKVDGLAKLQPLKAKILGIHDEIESPIDYNKSQTKTMPLAADSLKMNVQYFSFDENQQSAKTQASAIKSFITSETEDLFTGNSQTSIGNSAQKQVNSQYENHSIAGTLVISITCTHKDALLLAPFIIDVDKAIRVWNKVFKDDKINVTDAKSFESILSKGETQNEKSLTLLSGATFGSCFVGMVHVLNTSTTQSSEKMYSLAESMQTQLKIGGWFENFSGGTGQQSSFSNDVKNLLSSQSVSSHCTLVTMGSIPSIKSNSLNMGVKQFADFDGAKAMTQVATLQNATGADLDTVDAAATKARTGGQMAAMKRNDITSVLTGLADVDKASNKLLDTNSMMDAMDDYIQKALAGNIGVPINYYVKPITKFQLAEMWVAKYYPGKFMTVSGDDSAPAGAASAQSAPAQGDASSSSQ